MGLAGVKNRTKLSTDPNNNKWAKSTTSFGHKLMSSQGWKPGQYLGANDAAHAQHYTKANASHIRVMLKEDNLGLGASVGGRNAETFGLSMFSGLLGRLNGKEEAVLEKEQSQRRDVELANFQGRKYGSMNFVSAGYLVGDKIQDVAAVVSEPQPDVEPSTSKKRKRKQSNEQTSLPDVTSDPTNTTKRRKVKDSKSSKKDSATSEAKAQRRADKEARRLAKEAKIKAKTERRQRKADAAALKSAPSQKSSGGESANEDEPALPTGEGTSRPEIVAPTVTTVISAPIVTPEAPSARFAARRRYIQHKRMANMDSQAMREIFMIPSAS